MMMFSKATPWLLSGGLTLALLGAAWGDPSLQQLVDQETAKSAAPVSRPAPDRAKAVELNNRGLELANAGKLDSAIDCLREARQLDGDAEIIARNLVVVSNNYALTLAEGGAYLRARNYLDDALALAERQGLSNEEIAQLKRNAAVLRVKEARGLVEDRVYAKAERLLVDALSLDGQCAPALRMLGDIAYKQNQTEAAQRYYAQAAAAAPDSGTLSALTRKLAVENRVEEDFSTRKRGRFQVDYGDPSYAPRATEALRLLAEASHDVGRKLGLDPHDSIVVKIYDDPDFQAVTGAPHWSAGLYDGRIRLRAALLSASPGELSRVLAHEYTHALLADRIKSSLPAWLHEGLAQYCEGDGGASSGQDALVRTAAHKAALVPLGRMQETFVASPGPETARLLYAESISFISQLASARGEARLRKLLSQLAAGAAWDNAWRIAYNVPLESLEKEWRESLAR